jgi:alkylglycerol monooxygenase
MNSLYLQYAIPVFFILIFAESVYSHYKGLKLYNLRNSISALACGMFTTTLEVLIKGILLLAYVWAYDRLAYFKLDNDSWLTWILALVVFDFIWYWAHRISHEVNVVWGGHVPHHQSEDFNLSTGLRQGALQDLFYWPLYILMAPLGFSVEMFVAHMLINKLYGFWLHTQTIGKIPFIEGILSTPSAHRVHHGMNDDYIDKNYGGIFIIFDRLFGTYQIEHENVIYGVRKRHRNYNPVTSHFDWLYAIYLDAKLTESWWDKCRIWFMPTGWRPVDVETLAPNKKRSLKNYEKFDAQRQNYPITLMLTLFLPLATVNQVLIFQGHNFSIATNIATIIGLTMGLLWLGRVLNNSRRNN